MNQYAIDRVTMSHAAWGRVPPLIDLNPLNWLGDAAQKGAAAGFTGMMTALWSSGLWLLQAVFKLLDRFTAPDVQDPGLLHLYRLTLWVSFVVALVVALAQIGRTAVRGDGRTLATMLIGLMQYGAVVTAWTTVCAGLILASAGLTTGILQSLLHVDSFSGYAAGAGWVDQVHGTVQASVLGLCALFMLIPAAFGYILIMLVREAALLVLTATMPIAAAGALGESTRGWMWKSVRWFLAAALTSPLLALVLGVGVQISQAAFPDAQTSTSERAAGSIAGVTGPGTTALTTATSAATGAAATAAGTAGSAQVGMTVVGCVIMLVACFSPMALFRLLAFVDPGTASGASLRTTLSANGGVAGLIGARRTDPGASETALQTAPDGRSAAEGSADAETANRFQSSAARTLGGTLGGAGRAAGSTVASTLGHLGTVAQQGASLGVDVMGQAGIGHQGYYDASPPPRAHRPAGPRNRVGQGWDPDGDHDGGSHDGVGHEPGHPSPVPPEAFETLAEDGAFLA